MPSSIIDKLEKWFDEIERRRKVVIADNETKLAGLYQEWLEEKYTVKLAHNQSDLKEKINYSTDCIIIDRYFSDKTDDLITKLKSKYPKIPIILLTVVKPEKDQAVLDIEDYLIKPVDKKKLTEKVGKVTKKRSYLDA